MTFLRKKKSLEKEKQTNPREFRLDPHNSVKMNSRGLVPVILQDAESGEVLRLAYMDRWALNTTLEDKTVYIFRRRDRRLEKFGSDKGLEYKLQSIKLEETNRALLMKISAEGTEQTATSFNREIELFTEEDFFTNED